MHRFLTSTFVRTLSAFVVLLSGYAATHVVHAQTPEQQPLLTLDEAVRLALRDNYGIRIARNEAGIAENNYTLGNAGYLPTLDLTVQQSQNGILSPRTTPAFGDQSFESSLGLSFTIFDGFARSARYRRLRVLSGQGQTGALQTAEATLAQVMTRYFDVASQQQQLDVLKQAESISQERLDIAALRRDLGSASELEVRRAQVDLNADRAARLRQEVTLSNTKAALNQALGRDENPLFRVTDSIRVRQDLSLPALHQTALDQNKALQLAESSRRVAELTRQEARADWFPQLDLQLGYGFNDLTNNIGLASRRPGGFNYGLSASFDIFDGLDRSRRLQNAQIDIENSQLLAEDVRTRVQTELHNTYAAYQNSLQLIDLEQENVNLAEQNVDVALEQFKQGTITSVELREVQTALLDAHSRLVTARFEAKSAEIDLLRLSGQLLDSTE
ncbi:MAG TPA: TolC family protein [Rhodothermales bacterium]|nr:TolC family protein [Rhodothermales bacterium]